MPSSFLSISTRAPASPGSLTSLAAVLILAAVLAAFAPSSAPAQTGVPPAVEAFDWLDWPESAQSVSEVVINRWGQVALTASTDLWTTRAYYLVGDDWGAIPAWENAVGGINDDGVVAGWMTNGDDHPTTAYTWDPVLGLLVLDDGLPDGTTGSRASDINHAGTLVGRVFIEQEGSTTAWPFRLDDDGLTVLFGSVTDGEPMAVNEAGQMVVRAFEGTGNALYLIEPDGTVAPLPGAPWALANPLDINDLGWIVGDAESADFSVDEAFLWDGEQYVMLSGPAGFTSADAEAVNDLGQIAGWGWNGGFRAVVWQDGEPFDLGAVVSDHLGTSVDLRKAFSITDDGWVAGWGQGPGGGPEIFRVKLGPPCPDPASGEGMVRWTGADGSFQDGGNWSEGEVPGADQIVHVGGGEGVAQITLDADATNQSLVLVASGGGALIDATDRTWTLLGEDPCLPGLLTHSQFGELALHDLLGGTLSVGGGASLEHGGNVTLAVYGGQRWAVTGGPLIAGHPDTTGFHFSDGSTLDAAQEVLLGLRTGERAAGRFTAGSGLTAERLVLGGRGSGVLRVREGTVQAGLLILGETAGGHGVLDVGGAAGNIVTASGGLVVAEAGSGEMLMRHTVATVGPFQVGALTGSDGLVTVDSTSSLLITTGDVGNDGVGVVELRAGGELLQSQGSGITLGGGPDGRGELRVSGADARVSGNTLQIGGAGEGTVTVASHGRLAVENSILLGDQPGSHGDLLVAEGQVNATALHVGDPEGGTGSVVIDSLSVVIVEVLEVAPQSSLVGPIIELGLPGGKSRDTPGAVRTQELRLAAGATVDVDSLRFGEGWTLGGTGAFPFDVTNTATVDPGDSLAAGTLQVAGSYEQTPGGRLRIDVFGPGPVRRVGEADRLDVTGGAALAGTLMVRLSADSDPEVDDRHRIVTAASVTGEFDALVVPPEIEAELDVGASWVDLIVTNVITPVELPRVAGHRDGRAAVLDWRVAPGTGADRFVVRHRPPGATWRTVAEVPDDGSTTYRYRADGLLGGGSHGFRIQQWRTGDLVAVSATITVELPPGPDAVLTAVVPNPFNPRATFALSVARAQHVRVRVLDLRGREVAMLHDGELGAGAAHRFVLDGRRWASGAYVIHAEGEGFVARRKVMLLE